MLCSEQIAVNKNSEQGQACLLKCRRWTCDKCLPDLRREVIRKAIDGKPNAFITLTCNPQRYSSPDDAARDMKRALVLLRRHLRERQGIEKLPFIVVYERTKNGWPHMHILCRAKFIPQKWLSGEMARLIGAPVVDVRRVRSTRDAAAYVAKYIGKEPFAFGGCKRWWRSHNYDLADREPEPKVRFGDQWSQAHTQLDHFIIELERSGAIIEERSRRYVRWKEDIPTFRFKPRNGFEPPGWAHQRRRQWA